VKLVSLLAGILLSQQIFALTNSLVAEDPIWSSVVKIEVDGRAEDGQIGPGFCVATLLRSNMLVTAAHCVNDANKLFIRGIRVIMGHYIYRTMPDGSRRRIGYMPNATVRTTGSFLTRGTDPGSAGDMAVVILDHPLSLPEGFRFPTLATAAEVSAVRDYPSDYWPTIVTLSSEETTSSDFRRMARLNDFSWAQFSGYYQSQSLSRVQPGDSGAPVFVRIGAHWKLLATVKGHAKNFYSEWDVFESAEDNLCAIVSGRVRPDLQRSFCSN